MQDLIAIVLAAAASIAPPQTLPASAASPGRVPVAAAEFACAGIGRADRADPRWTSYNLRVEFSNPRAEYLSDGAIEVRDPKGRLVVSAQCDTPWVLLRLAPGAYRIDGAMGGASKSVRVAAPKTGQQRVVLQFPID